MNMSDSRTGMTRRDILKGAGVLAAGAAVAGGLGETVAGLRPAEAQQMAAETGVRLAHVGGDGSFKRVVDNGITFGLTNDAPYNWRDPATNARRGIDYDITMAAVKLLGITKIAYSEGPWDSMVPGLVSKRFDYLVTNIHVTAARLQVIDFTAPAYFYADWLIVQRGNPKHISTWDSLKGHTAGTMRGENYVDWLNKRKDLAGVKVYTDVDEYIQDLSAGRVDAIIGDQPELGWYLKVHPTSRVELVTNYVPQSDLSDWTRYGVRKEDNDLNNAFSRALEELRINGTLSAIMNRYGLLDKNLAIWPKIS